MITSTTGNPATAFFLFRFLVELKAGRELDIVRVSRTCCVSHYLCLVSAWKSITCRVGWWLGVPCTQGFRGCIRGTCARPSRVSKKKIITCVSSDGSPSLRGPTTPLCGTNFTPSGFDRTDWGSKTWIGEQWIMTRNMCIGKI